MTDQEITLTAREWSFHVAAAPGPVTGMTSGLNEVACLPVRIEIQEATTGFSKGDVIARLDGPRVKADGTPGASHVSVKVVIQSNGKAFASRYPQAPEWLVSLYRSVS